jgi:hypothetical protein
MKLLWKCFVAACALALSVPARAEEKPAPAMTHPPVVDCCQACNGCADECDRGGLLFDVGFLILTPHWKTNPALFISRGGDRIVEKDFTDATQFVPRLSAGYVNGDGFGGRIGWWGFATSQTDQIANTGNLTIFSAAPLGIGIDDTIGGMAASMALRMDVWDLELIKAFDHGCWSGLLTGGVRYAHMSQDYNAVEFEVGNVPDEIILSGHNFDGVGPTVSLQVRRDVGQALYVSATTRGSLLFGQGEQTVTEIDDGFLGVANATYDLVLPVAEIELGAGWKREMGRGVAFAEAGFNAQAWIDAGNASRSAGLNEFGDAFEHGTISDPTLGLFGFYLKAGLTF